MKANRSIVTTACILFAGWGLSGTAGAEPPAADQAGATAESNPQSQSPPEQAITLLSAGVESDRRLLRYAPPAGSMQTVTIWSATDTETRFNDHPIGAKSPGMSQTLKVTVLEPGAGGEIRYSAQIMDIAVDDSGDPTIAARMRQGVNEFKGMVIEATLTASGVSSEIRLVPPSGASSMAKTMLEGSGQTYRNLSIPLPEVPVGLGAKWLAVQYQTAKGAVAPIAIEYTLMEWTADGVKLTCKLTQTAEPQDVSNKLMPEGTTVHLNSLTGAGEGEVELDFSTPIALRSTLTSNTDLVMEVTNGSKTDRMTQTTKLKLRITSEQVKPASK